MTVAKRFRGNVLVTGCAGFIGMHVAARLLETGHRVVGIDSLNSYYSVSLKRDRLKRLRRYDHFRFQKGDLKSGRTVEKLFDEHRIERVCHLAAQAGVRYSLQNPFAYVESNLVAFQNLIQAATEAGVANFVYASSSSVYGGNRKVPFSENDRVDRPVSLYAATKKSNELVAHCYSHLYELPATGLRFFTVYGPWGRPDMALFLFTRAILEGRPIPVFHYGRMLRDFTYVDDIVDGVIAALDRPFRYEIFNLGNHRPVRLTDFIGMVERCLGRKARKKLMPMQPGDVPRTFADIRHARQKLGWRPRIAVEEGVRRFVEWYLDYYRASGS